MAGKLSLHSRDVESRFSGWVIGNTERDPLFVVAIRSDAPDLKLAAELYRLTIST
jgi:hypothetical protein